LNFIIFFSLIPQKSGTLFQEAKIKGFRKKSSRFASLSGHGKLSFITLRRKSYSRTFIFNHPT